MNKLYSLYRNLHTKTFSLKYNGKVISHPTSIVLSSVEFKVSEAGRQRVLASKRKNVHATVNGCLSELSNYIVIDEITYNPYTHTYFMLDSNPIYTANFVLCSNNKIFLIEPYIQF